jgi:hypothetical protein
MTLYNTTNLDAANNILQTFIALNDLTGSILVALLLFALLIIIMMSFYQFDRHTTFTAATFLISIVAILLTIAGVCTWAITTVPIVVFLLSLFFYFFRND